MARCFFLDMNSFYASVEQQEDASLRGRPLIVAPLLSDSTCAIAVSSEAKAVGIKTGMSVREARRRCPRLNVMAARPGVYLDYHARLVEVLNGYFTRVQALSVDEMACWISRLHDSRGAEERLAREVKRSVQASLGPCLRCSAGIAPNVFLAKVASDREKPDGLTIYEAADLPGALLGLRLKDLPGIGARMAARLEAHGIMTTTALWAASRSELRAAWGGVVGERWWYMLRGSLEADYGANQSAVRKSVGHSHVLPPEFRTQAGAQEIALRLFAKCLQRLRAYGQAAARVEVRALYREERHFTTYGWKRRSGRHLHANDDVTWLKTVRPMIASLPLPKANHRVKWVAITFTDLLACGDVNLSLFDEAGARARLSAAADALNARFPGGVGTGGAYWLREQAPDRIAFGAPDRTRANGMEPVICAPEVRRAAAHAD